MRVHVIVLFASWFYTFFTLLKRKDIPVQTYLKPTTKRKTIHSSNHRLLPATSTDSTEAGRRMPKLFCGARRSAEFGLLNQVLACTEGFLAASGDDCDA